MGFEAAVGERFQGELEATEREQQREAVVFPLSSLPHVAHFKTTQKKGLTYKIQVQLKFQILVTSQTFLSKVTICYFQVVYLILLYIFFFFI